MATPAAPEHRGAGVKPRKLSEELAELHARFATKPVTLREVIYTLRGRAYSLLVILLALPYLVTIAALAIAGRNAAYPGAYLKPYRRE